MNKNGAPQIRLFSYGTLQLESVQRAQFGRRLEGKTDRLTGYRLDEIAIHDPLVLAQSGQSHHPILIPTGLESDQVEGQVFALTPDDLDRADTYEVSDYQRISVTLSSGLRAYVYVKAPQ